MKTHKEKALEKYPINIMTKDVGGVKEDVNEVYREIYLSGLIEASQSKTEVQDWDEVIDAYTNYCYKNNLEGALSDDFKTWASQHYILPKQVNKEADGYICDDGNWYSLEEYHSYKSRGAEFKNPKLFYLSLVKDGFEKVLIERLNSYKGNLSQSSSIEQHHLVSFIQTLLSKYQNFSPIKEQREVSDEAIRELLKKHDADCEECFNPATDIDEARKIASLADDKFITNLRTLLSEKLMEEQK